MPEIWEWHSIPICRWETRNKHFQNSLLPSSQHWTHLSLLRTRIYETTSACPGYITHCLLLLRPKSTVSGGSWETAMCLKCLCSCHTDSIEMRPYVTPMPLELHWLSVKRSITFKTSIFISTSLSLLCDTQTTLFWSVTSKTTHSWTKIRKRSFSPVQLQGHGSNYPLQCAKVRVCTQDASFHRLLFWQSTIIINRKSQLFIHLF